MAEQQKMCPTPGCGNWMTFISLNGVTVDYCEVDGYAGFDYGELERYNQALLGSHNVRPPVSHAPRRHKSSSVFGSFGSHGGHSWGHGGHSHSFSHSFSGGYGSD